jgi:cyclopropane-fatty-acyl-phospholipid synthase
MANQKDIEAMYDWMDYFHILRLGDYADFTGAYFNGDFSKTLNQAQNDKHDLVFKGIKFKKGNKILDIGCGWGPILNATRSRGGTATGLTLSRAQNAYNKSKGLHSILQDFKEVNPKSLGKFDAVVSLGAFEHFCSVNEFKEGKQEKIYKDFFKFCSDVLPKGARLYLQTMIWGKKMPNPDDANLKSKKAENRILARTLKFYPGSWLPKSQEQIIKCAKPYFKLTSSYNGRLDYIETLKRWADFSQIWNSPKKTLIAIKGYLKLIPKFLLNKDFRIQLQFIHKNDQAVIFKREIFTHQRMFFEKK